MGIELVGTLEPYQVAMAMGTQRHSPGWDAYSMKHPRGTDDAVAKVMNGTWQMQITHIGGLFVEAQILKLCDYPHYAWLDGFVFPAFRGADNRDIQVASYKKLRQWWHGKGFPEIYCASFWDNTPAHAWIERSGYQYVGLRKEGSPRAPHGRFEDVKVYARRLQGELDMSTVYKRVDQALGGYWEHESGLKIAT